MSTSRINKGEKSNCSHHCGDWYLLQLG